MEYKYLAAWVDQIERKGLLFQKILKFQDQYALQFNKTNVFLQINLASEDSFCFFSKSNKLPFKEDNNLNKINQTLKGSKLILISLAQQDRVIYIDFSLLGLANRLKNYRLILEVIPRFQNIILTEETSEAELLIVDALKLFSFAENPSRQILPGQPYELPKAKYEIREEPVEFPLIFDEAGKISTSGSRTEGYYKINELWEDLFYQVILRKRKKYLQEKLKRDFQKKIAKQKNKLRKLKAEYADTAKEQIWKQRADLLKVNMKKLKPGRDAITLKDYFSETQSDIKIPVRSDLSAQQNVNLFYKKYKKARDGKAKIREQITRTKKQIAILEAEMREIRGSDLLFEEVKAVKNASKKQKKFRRLEINPDWEILIGRTSEENDLLTTKVAKPSDWWFHTRIFRGTHVVLRNYCKKENLPEGLLIICCRLAAYFSKAKKSSNVPVDYTQIKFVRKPRKSPPGFVVYTDQKTIYVDPLNMREAKIKINKWKRLNDD